MKKILFLLLSIILISTTVFSQGNLTKTNKNKKFTKFSTKKPDKYGEDLIKYFEDFKKEEIQIIITDFVSAYNSYPLDKKSQIIKTSNFYLKKRASRSPHFTNYFKIVMLMSESSRDQNNYKVLEEMIELSLVKQRKSMKVVDDFIKALLLLHEKDIMHSNRGIINWRTSAKDFKLVFDKTLTLEYSNTDLICSDPNDSLMIINTSGTFDIKKHIWKGTGGKVSWEKTGLPINEVYAEIDDYTIDLNKREYKVKSVNFSYSKYFSDPIKGSLHDKLQNVSSPDKKTYPRFEAFENVEIPEVVTGVDYKGPFTLKGSKFLGTNAKRDYAYLEIKKGDSVRIYARSKSFTFKGENIRGENTKVSIPIEDKEIRHPGVLFYYRIDSTKNNSRKVEMIRTSKGLGQSPFFNTYHRLEIDAEQVLWYINSGKIEFNNLEGVVTASGSFKSFDNFDKNEYMKMQRNDKKHPLKVIKKYSELFNTEKIDLKGLVRYMKRESYQVSQMLLEMSYKGFITYDPETGKGVILDRLYDYLKFNAKTKDFDILQFDSELDAENATKKVSQLASLDLDNLDMSINNVGEIPISSVHNVVCVPVDSTIVMKKDRNFTFNGDLRTEFLEFKGTGFSFDYESFRFNLDSVAYLKILIRGDTINIVDADKDFYYPFDQTKPGNKGEGILKRFVYIVRDSLTKEATHFVEKEVVQSLIQNITGELLIDDPSNKSGNQDGFSEYPKFICTKNSNVYYDEYFEKQDEEYQNPVAILGGKYNRKKFLFELDPFDVDSLGDFTSKSWNSPGNFKSSIFPDFTDSLTIQVDTVADKFGTYKTIYSLGFVRPDSTSYDVYKGVGDVQGKAFNSLKLSNKGLHGTGNLKYLTATIESNDFVYFPDFMVTDAFSTTIDESDADTEYAASMGIDNFVEWIPSQDTLVISSGIMLDTVMEKSANWEIIKNDITTKIREPLEMYNGQAVLTGQSIITPDAHVGWGTMEFSNSELSSSWFTFKMNVYDADTADFLIKPTGFIIPAFTAFDVNSHIDYTESIGEFKSNGSSSKAYFPINQFMTYMDQFIWDIDKNEIEVGTALTENATDRVGSEYISTHPTQDSLRFMSYSSGYSLEDFILRCYEVDSINISNGTVFPDSIIVIKENAEIDPLMNSVLVADNENRFHIIKDAVISVLGRKELKGIGSYDYSFLKESENGKDTVLYTIMFNSIRATRNDSIIRAYGKIEEQEDKQINLSDQFVDFSGSVELFTNEEFLRFKGVVSLNNECAALQTESIKFEGIIDPDSTVIEYTSEPTNAGGNRLASGFFSAKDSLFSLYSAFLSKSRSYKDVPFFSDSGVLYYDKESFEYIISSKGKYQNPDTIGNRLAFNNRYCYMTATGDLDIGAELGQVELKTIGNAKNNFATSEISLKTFLSVDFFFNDKATKLMSEAIFESTYLSGIEESDVYPEAIKRLVGIRAAEKLNKELSLYGQFKKMPSQLEKMFVFSEITFKWDSLTSSYKSQGDLNLVGIKDKQLNKLVPGYIEIVRKNGGDEISILLEPNSTDWYFFQYIGGIMFSISTDSEFNALMKEGKDAEREQKIENKGQPFKYHIGDTDARKRFIEKMTGEVVPDDEEEPLDDEDTDDDTEEDEGFEGDDG